MTKPTPQQAAAILGCTVEQVCAGYLKGAAKLDEMADKAARTGRKVNGYTETELREMARSQREQAAA